MLHIIDQQVWI